MCLRNRAGSRLGQPANLSYEQSVVLLPRMFGDEPGSAFQIWWDGLEQDKNMADYLRFCCAR